MLLIKQILGIDLKRLGKNNPQSVFEKAKISQDKCVLFVYISFNLIFKEQIINLTRTKI